MEVYKITCKINNKIYIGSTKLNKEKRWGDLSSSSSHLSCVRKGEDTPLYNDIKKYGAENFILETLEIITGDRHKAYERETYWIKYFWDKLGENMIYNQFKGSHGNSNWSVPHDKENQRKAAKARQEKYGKTNAMMITPEAMIKAKQTKINKYGNAGPNLSYEARKSQINKVSNRILDTYDNSIIIGYKNVLNKLLKEGYNVKLWQVKDLIYNKLSKNAIINYFGNENIIRRFQNLGKNS